MNNEKEFNFNFYLRATISICIIVSIICILSFGPFSQKESFKYPNYYKDAYTYMLEPKDTIDIVCVGTSEAYVGYNPHYIFEQYGFTSVNICMTYETAMRAYTFLKDLETYQHPKIIIIETDMLFYMSPQILESQQPYSSITTNLEKRISNINEYRFDDIISTRLTVFNYNNIWKIANYNNIFDFLNNKDIEYPCEHGFLFSNNIDTSVDKNYNMVPTEDKEIISSEQELYLDKIINYCNEKNIKYFLTEFPQNASYSYAKHNTINELSQKYNCDFIDFNLMLDEINFDTKSDFKDSGHLNYFGSIKVTDYLGKYIESEYSQVLIDHRCDNKYDFFKKSIIDFKKKYDIENLSLNG